MSMGRSDLRQIDVLIVNWNTCELLQRCLETLADLPEAAALQIIVVDNGSRDSTVEMLRRLFPYVHVIANAENAGFARANNQGFSAGSAPYVLLLNSDTEIEGGTIAHCRDYLAANPDVGVVGCRILNSDGSTQNSTFRYPSLRGVISTTSWLAQAFPSNNVLNHDRYGLVNFDGPASVEVVMGSFLMVRRSDHTSNLLDDGFFMYAEEADLCRRTRQLGLDVRILPDVAVTHAKGASSRTPRQRAWSDEAKKRAVLRFIDKWDGRRPAIAANLVMLAGLLPRGFFWWASDASNKVLGRPDKGNRHKLQALGFHLKASLKPSLMMTRFGGPPEG